MVAPVAASSFPWDALETLSQVAAKQIGRVRRAALAALRPERLASALGETLTAEAALVVRRIRSSGSTGDLPGARVSLSAADGSVRILLALEPTLASTLLARVLARPVEFEQPDLPLDARLSGALAALLVEVARRSGASQPLKVHPLDGDRSDSAGVVIEATLLLDGRPYQVAAWVLASASPFAEPPPAPSLSELGRLPVSVPIVGGICLADRAELEKLRPGDAWLCEGGWFLGKDGTGPCALAAPTSLRGAAAELAANGELVRREGTVELPMDEQAGEKMKGSNDTLADVVLDAPIVVRVEVGVVSMSAREWASLAPGDVISAGRRIADPVILRVAGREVAQGELVNVEGELGVRIQQIEQGE